VTALRVSVVVMTMDRPGPLRRCLDSLAAQTMPPAELEVVLVDASDPPVDDVAVELRDRLNVIHHPTENLGVSGNRNTGVALARAPVVAFLDDDCVAEPVWLERLTAEVEADPGCLAGGRVENGRPGSAVAVAGQVITEGVDAFFNPPGGTARFLPGLNVAFARDRYLALGGCDPRFGRLGAEDRDLADRWRLAGGCLVSCPDAVVRHEHRGTLVGFVRQHVNYGRGAWHYHRVRRHRRSGRMTDDIRLHWTLGRHLGPPLMRLDRRMRAKAVLLLGTWQLANAVGFVFQGVAETALRRDPRRRAKAV
jgi:glycosyltransferase involved in cell wall biosynthesis